MSSLHRHVGRGRAGLSPIGFFTATWPRDSVPLHFQAGNIFICQRSWVVTQHTSPWIQIRLFITYSRTLLTLTFLSYELPFFLFWILVSCRFCWNKFHAPVFNYFSYTEFQGFIDLLVRVLSGVIFLCLLSKWCRDLSVCHDMGRRYEYSHCTR